MISNKHHDTGAGTDNDTAGPGGYDSAAGLVDELRTNGFGAPSPSALLRRLLTRPNAAAQKTPDDHAEPGPS